MNPFGFPVAEVLAQRLPSSLQGLHVNYRYILSWSRVVAARTERARILDFGCGPGMVVEAARSLGLDCYGADSFYSGEADLPLVRKTGLLGTAVRTIQEGRVPFENESFDLIVSNQVLEHVEHPAATFSELSRLIKPDGLLLFLFPTREVIREAHCGVPFLHWLEQGSPLRAPYAARWKWAGFSFDKEHKTRAEWGREAVAWMDKYVFYRSWPEVRALLRKRFEIVSVEDHYLTYRLLQQGRGKSLAPFLRVPWLKELGRRICLRFNGVVVLARKHPAPTTCPG